MATNIQFNPTQLLALASDPAIEAAGSIYYNTNLGVIKTSDGVSWNAAASTDIVGGFYLCASSETLTVPINRVVYGFHSAQTDGKVIINGILSHGGQ